MKIKVKDIELDLPNDVGVEIFEDGKRVVISQPPAPFTPAYIPYYHPSWLGNPNYPYTGPTCVPIGTTITCAGSSEVTK